MGTTQKRHPFPNRSSFVIIFLAVIATIFVWYLLSASSNQAQEPPPTNDDCLQCHEASTHEDNLPYNNLLDSSIHAGFGCIDCHAGITTLPHDEPVAKVDCGTCHSEETETYKWHGRLPYPGGEDIPACTDCHGRHTILSSSNPKSRTSISNLPHTCGKCHENIDLVNKHDILDSSAVSVYENSVHGTAAQAGSDQTATCIDCHSTGGSAHRILVPGNPESSINHFNIPNTCGKCHGDIAEQYWKGIHGQLVKRGETGSPVCTNCHGEHGIISPKDPRSPVSPNRIAEATCSPCHESAYLNEKYGIPSGRLKTWVDSYHGLKSRSGDIAVANCASCHSAHMILPQSDPLSTINPANVQNTCGQCHPGISATLASATVHVAPGTSANPIAGIVKNIYIFAIFFIIGLMLLHVAVDYRKQLKLIMRKEQVQRMTGNEVIQHWLLLVSFTVLVITGFALRYSEAWWVTLLFGWEGGFPIRGIIHRTAGVLFIFSSFWHLFYLQTARGKQFLRDMLPKRRDASEVSQMIRYNLDKTPDRPQFGRFSYIEKMEYWALVWGTIVMIVTGLFLWFDNLAIRIFPKGFLDVVVVVHFYEAVLASLAILIWHLYSTVFSPAVYPMNPSWINGKTPRKLHEHEHPNDPTFTISTETVSGENEAGASLSPEPQKTDDSRPPSDEPPKIV